MGRAVMRRSMTHTTGGDIVTAQPGAQDEPFRLDEATIEELHAAIQAGRTTCVAVVQHYEAATKRRVPPPAFGPLSAKSRGAELS